MNSSLESDIRVTLDDIFQTVCDMPPDKRSAYLDEACAGDEALRREVEELIRYYETNRTFLEKPAIQDLAQEMAESGTAAPRSPMIGRQIGSYRILAMIGKGGMGEVYLAHDNELDVDVAIKFLPEAYASDPEWQARFNREGRLNAELAHQNIAALRHKGDADGRPFLVFEYVPGETLEDKLDKGTLTAKEALPIFKQLAAALAHAHANKIIHRDLKPANIKITPDGQLKVLDFGIAKRITTDLATVDLGAADLDDQLTRGFGETRKGEVIGTVAYMSPEQTRGQMLDAGTDMWSFGVVMYQALTGKLPFKGVDTYDTLSLIRDQKHEPDWRALPSDTPKPIQKLLRQCFVKERMRRAPSAAEALKTIEQLSNRDAKRWRRIAAVSTSLLVIALSLIVWWYQTRPPQQTYLAVLPFKENIGQNRVGVGGGLMSDLRDSLATIPNLNVLPQVEVAEEKMPQGEDGPQRLRNTLGVNWLIEGEVQYRGEEIEIQVRAYNANRKEPVTASVKGARTDYSSLRAALVNRVAAALNLRASAKQVASLNGQQAQEKYLQALTYLQGDLTEETIEQPIRLLRELSQPESSSGKAPAALAQAYLLKYQLTEKAEWQAEAERASEMAVRLEPSLPEVGVARGMILLSIGNQEKAIEAFNAVLQQRPNDLEAIFGLAQAYEENGRREPALQHYQRAALAWPNYWKTHNELGVFYARHGYFKLAEEQLNYVLRLGQDSLSGLINLGNLYVKLGRYREAEIYFSRSLEKQKTTYAYLGLGAARFYDRQYAGAIEAYKAGLQANQDSPLLWSGLGDALRYVADGNGEATNAYTQALSIRQQQQPDAVGAARLAELFAKRSTLRAAGSQPFNADRQKSLDWIKKALELDKVAEHNLDDPDVLAGAIIVYATLGESKQAASYVLPALEAGQSLYDLENDPDLRELRQEADYQRAVSTYRQTHPNQ